MFTIINMGVILYFTSQLLLAIIATIRYIVTVKASPMTAALIATAYSTISSIGTKLLTTQSMYIIIIASIITNLVGVLIGRLLVDRFTKARLWVYNATIKCDYKLIEELRNIFKRAGIHSMYDTVSEDKMYILKIFAESKEQSKLIKSLLNAITSCKYHIIESR